MKKYTGDVMSLKMYSSGFPNNKRIVNSGQTASHSRFTMDAHHETIISKSIFDAVQEEKAHRSIVCCNADRTKQRSDTHYTMKKK